MKCKYCGCDAGYASIICGTCETVERVIVNNPHILNRILFEHELVPGQLQAIVDFLKKIAGEGGMASIKINSEGRIYLGVGVSIEYGAMDVKEFIEFMKEEL